MFDECHLKLDLLVSQSQPVCFDCLEKGDKKVLQTMSPLQVFRLAILNNELKVAWSLEPELNPDALTVISYDA